jgi:hypothetical protein
MFTTKFKKIIEDTDFHQILFLTWMRQELPSRTYILWEKILAPGFKASKDQLTLLFGGNTS